MENDGNHPYPGTGLLSDSTGTPTGITYSINYDGNNGGLYFDSGPYQGTPAFLLGQAALANGTDVGTLTLNNVSAGSYDLYLYGANYDGDRGALFTVNSGTPVGGLSATTNPNTGGPMNTFILGGNYVEFTGVTPDINGNINITWAQNTSDSHGGGEGDFNGMSLVATAVPEPTTLAFIGLGIAGFVAARQRK